VVKSHFVRGARRRYDAGQAPRLSQPRDAKRSIRSPRASQLTKKPGKRPPAITSHGEFLELALQDELLVRNERLIARPTKAAGFRELKTQDEFEFSFNTSVKRKQVFDLVTGRFIREAQDLLLIGLPGTGKSHFAQAQVIRLNLGDQKRLGRALPFDLRPGPQLSARVRGRAGPGTPSSDQARPPAVSRPRRCPCHRIGTNLQTLIRASRLAR